MTGFESDVRLRTAFRTLSELPVPEVSEDMLERIWLAVSGELPPDERRELIDRTASDPACAEAWRVAHEMWLASQGRAEPAMAPAPTRRWWSPRLAAAAALLLATTAAAVVMLNRPRVDEFRASPAAVVRSLVPAGMPLPRADFRLRWTPAPPGSRYHVRVTTDDLRMLTAADPVNTEFVVEPDALLSLPDGAIVLWQVEVWLPTGERITSSTFAVRVE